MTERTFMTNGSDIAIPREPEIHDGDEPQPARVWTDEEIAARDAEMVENGNRDTADFLANVIQANPARRRRTPPPQLDLFIANLLDAAPKDTRQQLEFPVFSISKKPDTQIRRYEDKKRGLFLQVTPSVLGLATIHDKDILIYCASQIVCGMNNGREPSQTVSFTSHDLLKATNRGTGGNSYALLEAALQRLKGTMLSTNITSGGQRPSRRGRGFGLIDNYEIFEGNDTRMVEVRVKLSDWFYRAITAMEVLTLHRDYFRLKSPLDRALYEIARKHCGKQRYARARVATLHKKTGSRSALWKFRQLLARSIEANALPEYRMIPVATDPDLILIERRDSA